MKVYFPTLLETLPFCYGHYSPFQTLFKCQESRLQPKTCSRIVVMVLGECMNLSVLETCTGRQSLLSLLNVLQLCLVHKLEDQIHIKM